MQVSGMDLLKSSDPEIAAVIAREGQRQEDHIELIASENFASLAVMAAQGSCLTNKYAEGLPGKRYYGGCEFVDQAENLARERVKALFGAEHANVQPHSGGNANLAVMNDVVARMAMSSAAAMTPESMKELVELAEQVQKGTK